MKPLLIVCLFLTGSHAFAQSFQWVREGSGLGQDVGENVAVDGQGNVYATGNFSGEAEFGGTLFTGNGIFDAYVVKYDPAGNLLWLRSAGSIQSDAGLGVKADNDGNVYVTGYFSEIAEFRDDAGHIIHLASSGNTDIFLAKYDSSGNLLWAKRAGGQFEDKGNNIAIDSGNNIYITGFFTDRGYFDSQTAVGNGHNNDVFIACYDTSGSCQWVQSLGGSGLDKSFGIAVDSSGSCYITGFFYYDAALSNSATILHCDGFSSDIFVAKYDPAGNNEWAMRIGGPYNDASFGIAVDREESFYITGYFLEIADFGEFSLDAAGYNDVFVAKFDSLLECKWAISQGGVHLDLGLDIALDDAGNVYVAGAFDSVAVFGDETLNSVDYYDMFIAKYNDKGVLLWLRQAGGTMGDFALGLCVPAPDLVYVTGYYKNACTFGSIESQYGAESESFVTKIDYAVGIADHEGVNRDLLVYPNPSDGFFTLQLPHDVSRHALISVTDVHGREILQQKGLPGSMLFDLTSLDPGVYFVILRDEKEQRTGRIVVLR